MSIHSPFSPIRWWRPSPLPYTIIAGPCSAETEEQTVATATRLASYGITLLRASLWKPRTRPGGFEGVGMQGIPWLKRVQEDLDIQVMTEVASPQHVEALLEAGITTMWIGARTTSSPFAVAELAEALRGVEATVLVKNPINPDVELWEGALLRLADAGIRSLGAIHRGFSTYGQTKYRNAPLWQIPIELRRRHPDLTLIADPSHIAGCRELIEPLCREAIELNYDGLIVETHCSPCDALSDKDQQITPDDLHRIISHLSTPTRHPLGDLTLGDLRAQIDILDEEILRLLAQRIELSRQIGRYKHVEGMCIMQPERYRMLLESRLSTGQAMGLSTQLIHQVFSAIHEDSLHIQQQIR